MPSMSDLIPYCFEGSNLLNELHLVNWGSKTGIRGKNLLLWLCKLPAIMKITIEHGCQLQTRVPP